MKVFMFISGRSYGNNLKYKAFYVCMSFMLMALFSTIFTVKPAFATDSNPDDKNPHGIFSGSVKCPGAYIPKQDKEEKDSGWWGCGYRSGLYGPLEFAKGIDPVITCHSGRKAEFKTKTENITYKLGHCVEGTSSTNKSVVEKNAVALADKAGPQDKLVNLIVSKIETSPWYLGLSDADKVAAGCKYQSLPGAPSQASEKGWFCDDAAKKKLAKMLIGTCIASAIRTVAKRPDGQDKSNEQIDKLFTDCIAKNSGLDKDTVNNKAPIAWDDIKKDVDTSGSAATEESKKDCGDVLDSGLLGYFICPAINVAISFADGAWSIFEFFLINDPLDGSGTYYDSWTKVRDLANAILVVIFLGIVISQVSNIGISNYGIKKMLPRLVIVAVAINISYYLMQVIVDIANITGKSIDSIFSGFESYSGLKAANGWSVLFDSILLSATVAGSVGVTLAAGAVLGWPAIILFLGAMIIPAIIGIIAGLLALQVRSMLIPILAIFSPVALVAWVLPNTQKLFDKWKSMFTGLVFLYPLASIYYGGLKFAASITLTSGESGSISGSIQRLMALAALFIGTFMVAVIAIKSNSIMGKIVGGIGGFANKLGVSRLGGFVSNTASDMMSSRRAEFLSKGIGGRKNPFTIGAHKAMKRFSDNKKLRQIDQANYEAYADRGFKESLASGEYDSRLRSLELPGSKARIQEMTHSLISTEVKNAQISFGNASIQELKSALSDAIKNGDDVKARAAQNILLSGRGPGGIDAHNQAISESESYMSKDMSAKLRSNIQESNSGVFDKDPGLLKWASGQDSKIGAAHDAAAIESISLDKFTGMTKSSQLDRINGGGISSDQATNAINPSGSTFAKLDPEVVQALNKIANNKNNNENNSSSGKKLIIPTSQEDIRKALEDSRRRGN
jgi:hypothetical protein cdiviTM7_00597